MRVSVTLSNDEHDVAQEYPPMALRASCCVALIWASVIVATAIVLASTEHFYGMLPNLGGGALAATLVLGELGGGTQRVNRTLKKGKEGLTSARMSSRETELEFEGGDYLGASPAAFDP